MKLEVFIEKLLVEAEVGALAVDQNFKFNIGFNDEGFIDLNGFELGLSRKFGFHLSAGQAHVLDAVGAKSVLAWRHDANGGRAFGCVEGDGFDFAVKIFIGFEHGMIYRRMCWF